MFEGHHYTLQCEVQRVAPVGNLAVTFYRGQTPLGEPQYKNSTNKKPVTEIFTMNISTSKEDDGVQYWCEAKLELGPDGPQHPPLVSSQKLTATVLCESDNKVDTSQCCCFALSKEARFVFCLRQKKQLSLVITLASFGVLEEVFLAVTLSSHCWFYWFG